MYCVLIDGLANSTFTFAPVFGLGTFIILAKAHNSDTLTEGIAFAALSLFQLQDQPVISMLHGVEDIQTIINSFDRVQSYIQSADREDLRTTPESKQLSKSSSETLDEKSESAVLEKGIKLEPLVAEADGLADNTVIRVKDASAGYSDEEMILKDMSLEIAEGKTTMVVGPVGSGKSTLLRLLLGEMPEVSGTVFSLFSKCAYAPQSPWITWGTVQSNILGMSIWDMKWYNTIVRVCSLETDFEDLPDGDQTKTGTRGSRLSGGQQMRVVSWTNFRLI